MNQKGRNASMQELRAQRDAAEADRDNLALRLADVCALFEGDISETAIMVREILSRDEVKSDFPQNAV